MLESGILLHIR